MRLTGDIHRQATAERALIAPGSGRAGRTGLTCRNRCIVRIAVRLLSECRGVQIYAIRHQSGEKNPPDPPMDLFAYPSFNWLKMTRRSLLILATGRIRLVRKTWTLTQNGGYRTEVGLLRQTEQGLQWMLRGQVREETYKVAWLFIGEIENLNVDVDVVRAKMGGLQAVTRKACKELASRGTVK